MNRTRVIFHLARADFLERVRRYSFLIMLGLVVFLGYQVALGNVRLQLGQYRGEFNSAWVGSMMTLDVTFFLGWFGFYLVKGSVARDRETGVGQIMATTPLTRPVYTLGKWLSNLAVLTAMVVVLALAGIIIQFVTGENTQFDLFTYFAPFIFVALPTMALVAALAVLFETIPFLQSGFGNIVYFFLFLFIIPLAVMLNESRPELEPLGMALFMNSMRADVLAVYPDYNGSFTLGGGGQELLGTFVWPGIRWSASIILARVAYMGVAMLFALLAAVFFDRFDSSKRKLVKMRRKGGVSVSTAGSPDRLAQDGPVTAAMAIPSFRLTPLSGSIHQFNFLRVLLAELKLLLKGQRWWWYAIALILMTVCLANPAASARGNVLPFAWVWPILIWSALGNREARHNIQQITYSSPSPLWRQLPAAWLAGFIVTILTGAGALLRTALEGDFAGILGLLSGALFIPSLALACGVWSSSSKLFEVLYIVLWYIGPMSSGPELDFMAAHSSGNIGFFLPLSVALLVVALIGRARQLQN